MADKQAPTIEETTFQKYYIGSLRGKGMIEVAEIIHGYKRYKLTVQGISAVNDIDAGFERCLAEWFQKNGIRL